MPGALATNLRVAARIRPTDPIHAKKIALDRLDKAHLPRTKHLDVTPEFPVDVTAISDQEVGRLYGQFSAMVAYATSLTSQANIRHAERLLLCRRIRAIKMLRLEGVGKQDDRRATVELDDEVVEAENNVLVADAEARMFQAKLDEFVTGKETMSREVSRRKDLHERKNL